MTQKIYDYIIIGSGFGGSVSAMRLTQKGYSVLVIEQGKRYRDPDFATTNWKVWKYLWLPALCCFGILQISILKGVMILHGRGVGDLLDAVVSHLPQADLIASDDEDDEEKIFSIALVGRPNVGKSTLFNRLIGEERSITHDMPGTTRDTVDTVIETETGPIRFLDTAGMRRRSKIDEDTEYYSVVRALKAVDTADVALLVIDSTEGVTSQDQRLAERVDAAGCPIVLVFNKWDQLSTGKRDGLALQVERKLSFLPDVPVHRVSALTGRGVERLLPSMNIALDAYQQRSPTRKVNEVIRLAQQAHPAPHGARVLYATQGAVHPPTFTLFSNRDLPQSYLRYLERKLREDLELGPTPIKMRVRRRSN